MLWYIFPIQIFACNFDTKMTNTHSTKSRSEVLSRTCQGQQTHVFVTDWSTHLFIYIWPIKLKIAFPYLHFVFAPEPIKTDINESDEDII